MLITPVVKVVFITAQIPDVIFDTLDELYWVPIQHDEAGHVFWVQELILLIPRIAI